MPAMSHAAGRNTPRQGSDTGETGERHTGPNETAPGFTKAAVGWQLGAVGVIHAVGIPFGAPLGVFMAVLFQLVIEAVVPRGAKVAERCPRTMLAILFDESLQRILHVIATASPALLVGRGNRYLVVGHKSILASAV